MTFERKMFELNNQIKSSILSSSGRLCWPDDGGHDEGLQLQYSSVDAKVVVVGYAVEIVDLLPDHLQDIILQNVHL